MNTVVGTGCRIALADHIELRLLDGEGLVLDLKQQRLVRLNASAVQLWHLLEHVSTVEEWAGAFAASVSMPGKVAHDITRDTFDAWREAGWLLIDGESDGKGQPAGSTGSMESGPADRMVSRGTDASRSGTAAPPCTKAAKARFAARGAAWSRVYAVLGRAFTVSSDDPALAPLMDSVLDPVADSASFGTQGADHATMAGRYHVAGVEAPYCLIHDGMPLATLCSAEQAPSAVKEAITFDAMIQTPHRLAIEAAALCIDNGYLLLAGEHGSGKSTLAAGLLADGFDVAADDCVLLTEPALFARPVSERLCLYEPVWEKLSVHLPRLDRAIVHRPASSRRAARFYPPPDEAGQTGREPSAQPVRTVIFPRYVPGAPALSSRMGNAHGLVRLMGLCWSLPRPLDVALFNCLVDWAEDISFHELTFCEIDEAATEVRACLDATHR